MSKTIPLPTIKEVEYYLKRWDSLENYKVQEDSLDKLFHKDYPLNTDIREIMIKCSALNDFYSTNIFKVLPVAKHILKLNIDDRLKTGDLSLVNDIARVSVMSKGSEKTWNFYSFATKYCSHHNPEAFPIYDSYVVKVLKHFKSINPELVFINSELKDYRVFVDVIRRFMHIYSLEKFNIKDVDKYLWQIGKVFFES